MSNSLALSEKEKKKKKRIQKVFLKQRKHTCKLPCQLASQGCQTHLAPKEIQKANSRDQNPKFIFITAKVFFSWSLHPGLFGCRCFILVLILSGGVGILGFSGLGQEETFCSILTSGQHPCWAKAVSNKATWPSAPYQEAPVSMSLSVVCPRAISMCPYMQGRHLHLSPHLLWLPIIHFQLWKKKVLTCSSQKEHNS